MTAVKLFLVFFALVAKEVFGHGMVLDPPNRSSMWKFGYPTKINYDDNALFCGGSQVQWELNDGNCGVCGDDYRLPQPRPNENTGVYGEGYIGGIYEEGSVVKALVLITANHKGYFIFSICNLTNPDTYEDEDCFENLTIVGGDHIYTVPSDDVGNYTVELELPKGLTCDRCVFRWQYTAGNSWGFCPDGTGKLGCGPQETFRTCSDIRIVERT